MNARRIFWLYTFSAYSTLGIIGCFAVSFTCMGCERTTAPAGPEVKYGEAWNAERRRRSLPELEGVWHFKVSGANGNFGISWTPQKPMARSVGAYRAKHLTLANDAPEGESDSYGSGRYYPNPDPDRHEEMEETIMVFYSYERAAMGSDPWNCEHVSGKGNERLTVLEAEKLLASWGLKRLNY